MLEVCLQAANVTQPVRVPVGGSAHSGCALPHYFGHSTSVGTSDHSFHSVGDTTVRGGLLSGSASIGSHSAGLGDVLGGTQSQV